MLRPLFRYDYPDELKAIYRAMTPQQRLELLEELNEFTFMCQIKRTT